MSESYRTPDPVASPEELRAMVESQRRRAAVLEEVLVAICHDLRGPLNNVLGWSSLLRRSAPPEMTRGIDVIERSVRLQAWMLDDVCDLSRIAGGPAAANHVEANLPELVREVAADVQTGIGCSVALEEGSAGELLVSVDKTLVIRALRAVFAFLGRGHEAVVRVSFGARGGQAWASFTEPRRGHFPSDRFEEYLGGAESQGLFTRGAGLVLLVAHNVARAHGGDARVIPDGIEMSFPLSARSAARPTPVKEPTAAPEAGAVERSLESLTILVVDDDPNAREVLDVILSERGARVRTAESVATALRAFRAETPDVLVSDIGMPEQDGYDLIRQVRAMRPEQGATVPAIALSALTRPEDRNRSLRAGFQLHVSKPITDTDIVEAVKSLIRPRA